MKLRVENVNVRNVNVKKQIKRETYEGMFSSGFGKISEKKSQDSLSFYCLLKNLKQNKKTY